MNRIQVLSPRILDTASDRLAEMQEIVTRLRTPRGWHYYIDLCWVAQELCPTPGLEVLDAGAGNGVLQWWLAQRGARVLSVDGQKRAHPGLRFERFCQVEDLDGMPGYRRFPLRQYLPPLRFWRRHAWRETASALRSLAGPLAPEQSGSVAFLTRDLAALTGVASESLDAVVSISALEHNEPEDLVAVVRELERVLKPGGRMVVTTSGSLGDDWYHEPSHGWCFGEKTIAECFGLEAFESNFSQVESLFDELVACQFLRDDLPPFYFQGGDNGMPWGEWDPRYVPVGVVKTKA